MRTDSTHTIHTYDIGTRYTHDADTHTMHTIQGGLIPSVSDPLPGCDAIPCTHTGLRGIPSPHYMVEMPSRLPGKLFLKEMFCE